MQYRRKNYLVFASKPNKSQSPPKGLMTFPLKLRKTVAAKMKQTGRPAEHFSKTTGKVKKMYK